MPKKNGQITEISEKFLAQFKDIDIDKEIDELTTQIECLLTDIGKEIKGDIVFSISESTLKLAIESYYLDIFKYSEFHPYNENNKFVNEYKKAAFFVKWILKFKPIQTVSFTGDDVDLAFEANETIALLYALKLSNIDTDKFIKEFKNTKDRMIYNFLFRDFNESMFTLLLEAWNQGLKK